MSTLATRARGTPASLETSAGTVSGDVRCSFFDLGLRDSLEDCLDYATAVLQQIRPEIAGHLRKVRPEEKVQSECGCGTPTPREDHVQKLQRTTDHVVPGNERES